MIYRTKLPDTASVVNSKDGERLFSASMTNNKIVWISLYPSARIQPSVIATTTDVGLLEDVALHRSKF